MTREDFIKEMRAMHNHIVIVHDHQLGRLVGFHEDDNDYYYHVRHIDRGPTVYHSAVGHCESLKGVYSRYDVLDRIFTMNGAPPSDEFLITDHGQNAVRVAKQATGED